MNNEDKKNITTPMKRKIKVFAVALGIMFPIGEVVDALNKIAFGTSALSALFIFIGGIFMLYASYILCDKIIK